MFLDTQNTVMSKRQTQESGVTLKRTDEPDPGPKKPGRKPGKHSDERYTQTSIYLPIELRNRVRSKLYEKGMEMSGLVEDMLRNWLAKQQ